MKNILSISLIYFILALSVSAQENVLEVLSVKGKVMWKNSGKGDTLDLQLYQRLLPADRIILLDTTSRVRFINNKTKFVAELSRPGKYRVSSLLIELSWRNDLRNFIDFIFKEVKPDFGGSEYIVGVTRNLKGILYPPDRTIVLQDEIHFNWDSKNEHKQKFFIKEGTKNLIELCLADASLTLSTKSEILNQSGNYTWKGYNIDENDNPSCFIILSNGDRENLKKAVTEQKSKRTGNELFDLLELAKFYKQHNLFIEADSTYELILKHISYYE